mmetsp:Transcript_39885/g.124735  ORF Transcript_39885/g.124735 Transcript_39885/m.124735 type:complete len:450 (-) Transcript_39885:53-1402(-)
MSLREFHEPVVAGLQQLVRGGHHRVRGGVLLLGGIVLPGAHAPGAALGVRFRLVHHARLGAGPHGDAEVPRQNVLEERLGQRGVLHRDAFHVLGAGGGVLLEDAEGLGAEVAKVRRAVLFSAGALDRELRGLVKELLQCRRRRRPGAQARRLLGVLHVAHDRLHGVPEEEDVGRLRPRLAQEVRGRPGDALELEEARVVIGRVAHERHDLPQHLDLLRPGAVTGAVQHRQHRRLGLAPHEEPRHRREHVRHERAAHAALVKDEARRQEQLPPLVLRGMLCLAERHLEVHDAPSLAPPAAEFLDKILEHGRLRRPPRVLQHRLAGELAERHPAEARVQLDGHPKALRGHAAHEHLPGSVQVVEAERQTRIPGDGAAHGRRHLVALYGHHADAPEQHQHHADGNKGVRADAAVRVIVVVEGALRKFIWLRVCGEGSYKAWFSRSHGFSVWD